MDDLAFPLRLLLALFSIAAAVADLRTRRIPNWLTMGVLGIALAAQLALFGLAGLKSAGLGLLAALALTLPLFALRGLGGGDVKMMSAAGAIAGPWNFLVLFLVNAVVGGAAALVLLLAKGRLTGALRNIRFILSEVVHFRAPHLQREELDIAHAGAVTMPRGPLFAVSVLLVLAGRALFR